MWEVILPHHLEPQSGVVEIPLTECQTMNRINRVTPTSSVVRVLLFTVDEILGIVCKNDNTPSM